MKKIMKVTTDFGTYKVTPKVSEYIRGGIAVVLLEEPSSHPFATLTVFLHEVEWPLAYVDTNNCPWAEKFIQDNELGKPTGIATRSGYCLYPLYEFYPTKMGGRE